MAEVQTVEDNGEGDPPVVETQSQPDLRIVTNEPDTTQDDENVFAFCGLEPTNKALERLSNARERLGRGGPVRSLSERRSERQHFDPFMLRVQPNFNLRDFHDPGVLEHVGNITRSIVTDGGIQNLPALLVRYDHKNKGLYIVDGECRWRAVVSAVNDHGMDIQSIPCDMVADDIGEDKLHLFQLDRNGGRNYGPIELGMWYRAMKEQFGYSEQQLAERQGKTVSHVNSRIVIANLPEEIKDYIRRTAIAADLAVQLYREQDESLEQTIKVLEAGLAESDALGKKKITKSVVDGTARKKRERKASGEKKVKVEKTESISDEASVAGVAVLNDGQLFESRAGTLTVNGTPLKDCVCLVWTTDEYRQLREEFPNIPALKED